VYLSHVSVSECQTLQSRLVIRYNSGGRIGGGGGVAVCKKIPAPCADNRNVTTCRLLSY